MTTSIYCVTFTLNHGVFDSIFMKFDSNGCTFVHTQGVSRITQQLFNNTQEAGDNPYAMRVFCKLNFQLLYESFFSFFNIS